MLGWLYRILVGSFKVCPHSWETINEMSVHSTPEGAGRPTAVLYVLRCKNCGEITERRIS